MGDAQRHTWGGKYSLRKAVNPVNRPPQNCEKWPEYEFFAHGETQATAAGLLPLGRKRGAGRLRLSVCLFRTGIWLTAWMGLERCSAPAEAARSNRFPWLASAILQTGPCAAPPRCRIVDTWKRCTSPCMPADTGCRCRRLIGAPRGQATSPGSMPPAPPVAARPVKQCRTPPASRPRDPSRWPRRALRRSRRLSSRRT
jgi:hypothetical protein